MIEFSREGYDDFAQANKALTLSRVIFFGYCVKINGVEWMNASSPCIQRGLEQSKNVGEVR